MANEDTRHPRQASPLSITVAGILSLAVAMGIGRFAFTPLLPLMIQEGQLDLAAGGWIAAANYAGYLVGALTASRLRWSAVRLGTVALVMTAVLTAAMALPLSPWAWGLMRFAAGVCSAWAFVATAIWCLGALAASGHTHRGGAVYSGVGLGIAAAGLYCLAASALGANAPAAWVQLGVFAGVLIVPVALVLRHLHTQTPARAETSSRAQAPAGLRSLVICYGMLGFGYILPATFLPVMARSLVSDPRLFGLAWPVFGITAGLSTFIAGWVMRHASRIQVWAVSNVIMGVGVLLPSVWLNGATVALSALMVGGTFMIVTMAGVQEVRARAVGDATPLVARMTSAFALGQIAGPIASSLLLHVPRFAQSGLNVALQIAAVTLFVSAAWLWRASA
ncbi:MAG TPA: YbfB/YjiJ family MFS transporter [Ramlibacter sp.]|nr:YbfB/YjiJ family MFS transporter [Ramlibacter sp.]